jgi:hypothetical protein
LIIVMIGVGEKAGVIALPAHLARADVGPGAAIKARLQIDLGK